MRIQYKKISELKEFQNNARKHTKRQIEAIAESIRKYGFKRPLLIDKEGYIVCGHGSRRAAIQAGLEELPCIVADDLTPEQVREFRLVENRLGDMSTWDESLLITELESLDFESLDFAFDIDGLFADIPDDYKQTKNLGNFFKAEFDTGANEWGVPETAPFVEDLSGIEWVSFGEKAKVKDFSNIGLHFYIDDYKFESVWTKPDKWLEVFQQCRAVITPDFSNYTDMPKAQQLWNHYRRQWCGKYWQDNGVNIVSSLSFGIGQIYDWSFAGIPQGTMVAASFVGDAVSADKGIEDMKRAIETVKPRKVFIKANKADEKLLRAYFDFELIPPYQFKRKG